MSSFKHRNRAQFMVQFAIIATVLSLDYASAQIGLVCSKDSDCKMSASYVCGPRKTCACAKGYRFELAKFACGRHLVDQGEKCDAMWDVCKGGPNSECIVRFLGQKPVCQCKHGFVYHKPTELCQPPDFVNNENQDQQNFITMTTSSSLSSSSSSGVAPGGTCATNTDCRGFPNATCYYFVNSDKRQCDCTFDTHYYDSKAKTCLPKKGMGSNCESLDECVNLSNIQCTSVTAKQSFKTCSCKTEFYFNREQQKCMQTSEIGGNCQADEQCKARPHSFCDVSGSSKENNKIQRRCACLPGREFYAGAGSCVEMNKPIPFGQPCKTSGQCKGKNVVCKNTFLGMIPVCTCNEGYSYNDASGGCAEGFSDNSSDNEINSNFGSGPGSGSGSGSNSGGPGSQQDNMEVDLNFNVIMKVHCNKSGKCRASKTSIMNNE